MLSFRDSGTAITDAPPTDGAFFYAGGDAAHVWTTAEVEALTTRYRAGIWVRSNPQQASATADALAMAKRLHQVGQPGGTITVLDLETAVTPQYVEQYAMALHKEGWLIWPYGSIGTLQGNPALDGYWVSAPEIASMPSWAVAWQHALNLGPATGRYDLSWVRTAAANQLWDTQPPAPDPAGQGAVKVLTGTFGHLNKPAVAVAPMPTGKGYTLVAADGGTFTFGTAPFLGSLAGTTLNAPIVDACHTPTGKGLYMVATDGGVFTFGDAVYDGSEGGTHLNAPVQGMALTPTGKGYWLVAADGGVFCFGDAGYFGSEG